MCVCVCVKMVLIQTKIALTLTQISQSPTQNIATQYWRLYICLSACLSACLPVYLSVCLRKQIQLGILKNGIIHCYQTIT